MSLVYTDGKTKIKIGFLIIIFISIILFILFEMRKIIYGPILSLNCGDCKKEITEKPMYNIQGNAENIHTLSLGNKKMYIDSKGNFNEKIALYAGENIINIFAEDKFGARVKKTISVYYINKETFLSL